MKKFKVGIIGMGRMGKNHLELLEEYSNFANVKAVCDLSFDNKTEDLLKKYKVKDKYFDYKDLLADALIDVVYVCTDIDSLCEISMNAIKANKHTFCESNLSKSPKDIKKLMEVLKTKNLIFHVGLNKRFDNNFRSVKDVLVSGKIGEAHIIKITSRDPDLPSLDYLKKSGGLFFDMSVDDFDMIRYLSSFEVEEVYARGGVLIDEMVKEYDDIDTAVLSLKLSNGTLCLIDNSRRATYGYDQRVEIHGSLGMVTTSNELQSKAKIYTTYGVIAEKPKYLIIQRYKQAYIIQNEYFFTSILNNKVSLSSCNDSLQALYIALAAKKSFEQNRSVKISEVKHN